MSTKYGTSIKWVSKNACQSRCFTSSQINVLTSNKEQFTICIRWVGDDLTDHEILFCYMRYRISLPTPLSLSMPSRTHYFVWTWALLNVKANAMLWHQTWVAGEVLCLHRFSLKKSVCCTHIVRTCFGSCCWQCYEAMQSLVMLKTWNLRSVNLSSFLPNVMLLLTDYQRVLKKIFLLLLVYGNSAPPDGLSEVCQSAASLATMS